MIHGISPSFRYRLAPGGVSLVNGINLMCFFVYFLSWLVSRVRWRVVQESHFLAVDSWANYDKDLFSQITDNPDNILICHRDRNHALRDRDLYLRNRKCVMGDGRAGPLQALSMLRAGIKDMFDIWRLWNGEEPMLFCWLIALPLKRIKYAVFFNRFSVRYFWGRDDYSVEHVLRNQELRKTGGVSLGINHGLPHGFELPWKHIDFDIYYAFGRHLYETYYRQYWPPNIVVRPIGSSHVWRLPRKGSPPNDIVYFVNPRPMATFFMNEVFDVARHFPDRKILIKIKPGLAREERCQREVGMLASAPPNVVEVFEGSYEVMGMARYAISTGSTIVAEALQQGMVTFVIDGQMNGEHFYFREFPALCVSGAGEIIRRIEGIESGKEVYDFERYSNMIDMSHANIANVIRADMGLRQLALEAGPNQSTSKVEDHLWNGA